MINKFLKFGVLIFLAGVLFGSYSNAQTPVCNLQYEIFELSGEQNAKTLENVKAVLTDLATEKTKESSALTKTVLFSDLTSGKYTIEIIKDGYQRRIKEFELSCITTETIETISKAIFLRKGNSKEITEFESTTYKAAGENSVLPRDSELNKSVLNGRATKLAKPNYPAAARAVRASGAVNVQVTIDEDGEIVAANALSGHPLLRQTAEKAARESRFAPTMLKGQPVKITGIIVYNFVP